VNLIAQPSGNCGKVPKGGSVIVLVTHVARTTGTASATVLLRLAITAMEEDMVAAQTCLMCPAILGA